MFLLRSKYQHSPPHYPWKWLSSVVGIRGALGVSLQPSSYILAQPTDTPSRQGTQSIGTRTVDNSQNARGIFEGQGSGAMVKQIREIL